MSKVKAFFLGVRKEASKTHWPRGKELVKYSAVCIFLIIFFAIFFYGLDTIFAFLRELIS